MAENKFKTYLVKKIEALYPDCIVTYLNPNHIQGIPDLLILYGPKWATLEAKDYINAKTQPNQPYYVELMNNMSFSAFIYPENEDVVLEELHRFFMM